MALKDKNNLLFIFFLKQCFKITSVNPSSMLNGNINVLYKYTSKLQIL